LTDTATDRAIIGIEDMELLPDGDTLILSALDRLTLEWRPDEALEGGLYEVSLARLAGGQPWATPIIQPGTVRGGLFPQGIAISDDGERLAFVNRSRDGTVSIIAGALARGTFSPRATRTEPLFCRANDLIFAGGGSLAMRVTLDRESCGVSWADLKPSSTTGRVISVDLGGVSAPKIEETGLAFANGIAGLYVAETRGSRLRHRLDRPVDLPGGPDNLTWDPFGGLIAALHPSLYRLAAYRYGYQDTAPSRIVRVDLDRAVEVLFDDTGGKVFSGASVGVLAGGTLAAGSMRDAGLLVCRKDKS
jgi:sugar lactone lactonase YvrE